MIEKIKKLCVKHKQIILYLVFGFVTTVASLGAWYATMELGVLFWHDGNGEPTAGLDIVGSTVQWVVGVLVAFVTNKKWVFVDADKGVRVTVRQFATFTSSRVLTYILEVLMNLGLIWVFTALGYKSFTLNLVVYSLDVTERIWAKFLTAVAVVITNYVLSKLLVFRKSAKKKEK